MVRLVKLALVALLVLVVPTIALLGGDGIHKIVHAAAMNAVGKVARDPLPTDIDRSAIVEHHSFHPPLLADYPFDSGLIHWDFGLSATTTDDYVRLTPAKQSREGFFWNDAPCYLKSWTINTAFRIHSQSTLGGDGMAIWYTDRRSTLGGPLFGAQDRGFKGLGIVLDSFDNDGQRDNPTVSVIVSNGDDTFDTSNDLKDQSLGSCTFDFRNTAVDDLVRLTVVYDAENGLTVSLANARQQIVCATVSPLTLPEGYIFGLTSHTGHLADNHDIHYFVVTASKNDMIEEEAAAKAAHQQQQYGNQYQQQDQQYQGGQPQYDPYQQQQQQQQPPADNGKFAPFSHDDERREKERWQ